MKKILSLFTALMLGASFAYADGTNTTVGWHQVSAEPNLVVRSKPSVTGEKLGNAPHGGKIKVLEKTSTTDSIGGHDGTWVKIAWKNTTGYVFDAFLEPLGTVSSNKTSTKLAAGLVTVPDLSSDCVMDVEKVLKPLGLRAKEISVHGPIDEDAAGFGCAYRQSPKAGEVVKKGSTVTFRSWWEAS